MLVMYDDEEWLFKEYVVNKRTINEIASNLGVADSTVYKKLVMFDIPRRPTTTKIIYLDYDVLYQEYVTKGRSPYEICKDFDCHTSTIYNELKRLEIPIRSRRESKLGRRNPMFGKKVSGEHLQKILKSREGYRHSEETKRKISEANSGENNGQWTGIPFMKICETCGVEFKRYTGLFNQRFCSMKCRDTSGENNPAWIDGRSFEPYCPKFNFELKEKIRNRDNRVCQMPDCGKSEIENGERLTVHHIDGDKAQGCDGKLWYLVALCRSCNSKPDTPEKEFLIVVNM